MLCAVWCVVCGSMLAGDVSVAERAVRNVTVRRWGDELGIAVHTLTREVTMVKDFSPVAEAGIRVGDRIVSHVEDEKWASLYESYKNVLAVSREPSLVGRWDSETGRFTIRKTRSYVVRFTDRSLASKVLVSSSLPGTPCSLSSEVPPPGFSISEGGWCGEGIWVRWVSSRLELCFTQDSSSTCYRRFFAYRLPEVVPVFTTNKDNLATVPLRMLEQTMKTGYHMLLYIHHHDKEHRVVTMLSNAIVSNWANDLRLTHPSLKVVKVESAALSIPSIKRLGITDFPAFVFVRWGGTVLWSAQDGQTLVDWARELSSQRCILLNTTYDISKILKNKCTLISKDTEDTKYRLLADTTPEIACGVLNTEETLEWYNELGLGSDVALFRNYTYDRSFVPFVGSDYAQLEEFVNKNKAPVVVKYTTEHGLAPRVVLWWNGAEGDVWRSFHAHATRDLTFAVVDMRDEWGMKLAQDYGVDAQGDSKVVAYDRKAAGGYLYEPEKMSFKAFLHAFDKEELPSLPQTSISVDRNYVVGSQHGEAVSGGVVVAYLPSKEQAKAFTTILHIVNEELETRGSAFRVRMMNTALDEGAPVGEGVLDKLYVTSRGYKGEVDGEYVRVGMEKNGSPMWESSDRRGRVVYRNSEGRWLIGSWEEMPQEAAWVVSSKAHPPETLPQDVPSWALWGPFSSWVVTPHIKLQDGTTRLHVYTNSTLRKTCPVPTLVRRPSLKGACPAPYIAPLSLQTAVDCITSVHLDASPQ